MSAIGFSQSATTVDEVTKYVDRARTILQSGSYRETMTQKEFDASSNRDITFGYVRESVASNRIRCQAYAISGGKTGTSEKVMIGDNYFSRVGNQPWSRVPSADCRSGLDSLAERETDPINVPQEIERSATRRTEKLKNTTVGVFELTVREKYANQSNVNIFRSVYWFDDRGRILKATREIRATKHPATSFRTSTYEYDDSIKIEAPIK